jgi:tetratricopeptide (TPR) repeat protein
MRLGPYYNYEFEQGWAYSQLGQWEEAIPVLKRFSARHPDNLWSHVWLTLDYVELGRDDAAHAEAAEVLRISPQFSRQMGFRPLGRGKILAENQRFEADLRKAGLK